MKYVMGLGLVIIGAILWFVPQWVPAYRDHHHSQGWVHAYQSALSTPYQQEESSDVFDQPFQWRHYPRPVNMGQVSEQDEATSWDESDPLGVVFAYQHAFSRMKEPSDGALIARFRTDGDALLRQLESYYAQEENSFAEDMQDNYRSQQRWYAVADMTFADGSAGILKVTYDDEDQVKGASMDTVRLVNGVYRYFPLSSDESMHWSQQREYFLDYLGLKPEPPEDPDGVVYFTDHLAEQAAKQEAQQRHEEWVKGLLWYLKIAGALFVGIGGLIVIAPWRRGKKQG